MQPIQWLADHIRRYYPSSVKRRRQKPTTFHVMTQRECHQGADALPHLRCLYLKASGDCETFRCSKCKRSYPWCQGAADDCPDWCDDCRMKANNATR